jgi:hypothetical protein
MGSIPLPALSVKTQEQPDLLSQFGQLMQLKNMKQQGQVNAEQLKQQQIATEQAQQQQKDQQAFRAAMADPTLQGRTIGEVADALAQKGAISQSSWQAAKKADVDHKKALAESDEKNLANMKAAHDQTQSLYNNVMNMPDDQLQANWPAIAQQYNAIPGNEKMPLDPNKPLPKQALAQFGPVISMGNAYFDQELKRRGEQADLTIKQNEAKNGPKPQTVQTAEGVFILKPDGTKGARLGAPTKALQVNTAAPGATANDPKDIAKAIIRGEQPPTVTGLYRNAGPVRAELARAGFNLQKAESDWKAVQKHLSTLNGAQQERLRQAVTFTYDSLDNIESLYEQWKKLGPNSGIKVFNRAALATAKQLPGEAGSVAQALEAQINDLTSELGTVYKGGNASTDETLRLAAENLKADWNDVTFKRGIQQIRTNLGIRKNSILNSQPAGVSQDSPYNPTPQQNSGASKPMTITLPSGKKVTIE